MAAIMALNTSAAGPKVQSFLKMDPIAQSKTKVGSVLRALLIARIPSYVLLVRYLESQPTAVGLRSETPDLVNDCEILSARRKEGVSGKPPVAPMREGKSETAQPRRLPFDTCSRKGAARACGGECEGPILRQIDEGRAAQSQNPRRLIPIPVLCITEFHSAHKASFARFPSVVKIKERLALGNHGVVVANCAASSYGAPRLPPRDAAHKLSRLCPGTLIKIPGNTRSPVRGPVRPQAHPFVVKARRIIEKVVVLAEAQFVLCPAAGGYHALARFQASRIQTQRRLKFRFRLVCLTCCSQDARTRGVYVRPFWIQFLRGVDGLQCLWKSSFPQVNI